ncbi:DUF1552 domain-containing protein [bacterium]|nr:DUF1552 domain-containing protein [bacterium]MDB4508078.1 DUF1552 domain-containing protein [Akkermansiaceae bacterium]
MHISTGKSLSRRTVLKQAGIALGLPFLDAMNPAFGASTPVEKKRFVGVSLSLGLHSPFLVPKDSGSNYTPSQYLKSLQDIRDSFTVISGTSHPGVKGGHTAESSIFSACPREKGSSTKNTISLDQLMAKHHGHETRFPSLVMNTAQESSPSYTESGSMVPAMNDPRKLFASLFIDDTPEAKKRQKEIARGGQSIMDIVRAEAKQLEREVGPGDRDKLDEWFTSVRELEQRLEANEAWVNKPKPKVGKIPAPADRNDATDIARSFFDTMFLALQSDSTRFMTLHCTGNSVRSIEGVEESYHSLSHHGRSEEKLDQLAIVEQATIDRWADFLRKLKEVNLLDDTMVMLTSNLGNASSHDNRNMPVLFGGGGFKHGQHLAFSQTNNYPLPNLYLSMLQNLGMEAEAFATSSGTMKGLV